MQPVNFDLSINLNTAYLDAYGPGYEDMQRRIPDCTLARTLCGFAPRRTLDDIIEAVIEDQNFYP